ncbi:MAG: DNA polymerase III subunit alpha [Candidatus Nomurabacteria bacterium]|nr:MAG: DNA polymerase III subunit alpha [Candidatus Nomurabacteria bacterium]
MSDIPSTSSSDFIHLHVHSHYSLLNALPTPSELAKAAKADGQDALAITDAGAMYGIIDFYKACTKEGIKPILGLDAYLAPRTRHDKEPRIDKPRSRLVLLAKTFSGYQNMIKMVTLSNTEGFYYKPRLDEELLTEGHEDLICIIPSFAGEVAQALKDGDDELAGQRLDFYKNLFGDDCYLEITHHPEILDHEANQQKIIELARKTNTKLVAAHDVYYLKPEDRLARETMVKIQSGGVVDTTADDSDENFSFITQADAKELFKDTPDAIENTVKIANQCHIEIEIGTHWYFPNYIIESGKTPDDELKDMSYKGVAWRGMSLDDKVVRERLDYELDVIKTKGYATYFLAVGDLLREARERGILTTIRGSVAGSLTTYVLGITNVDPLEYKLPFERFLNPQRPSAPDIDMDYADNRRDEIIEYSKEKYGADKVAQIGTFGTMAARAAVRDVARALGHPYATGDKIAKLIPMGSQGFPMTIKKALEIEPDLADLYKKDSEAREVLDLAKQIEGRVRHLGVHAAGVVIAPEPLDRFVPIQPDPKSGKYITQYEMKSVGEDGVGLLKFDFLGIKNLAILADAVKRTKAIRGVDVDIENIPLDDPKTFEILAKGETMGLFQLNGSGMTAFLKQLKPTTIHDINAMVALYRPGPMESIPQYIERKHNPGLVTYLDPRLEPILDLSYGVITYQDDVMAIARELAGYSWLEADMLRKAMGKKIPEVMAAEKDKLLSGFVEHGKLSSKIADKLWALIEPFAAYGFNKAHAASYGRVAYQTAYMKANFPVEYMSAVLTADSGDTEKISEIIRECERMGIEVLPPDINESFSDFTVVSGKQTIRFGLTTIKNFGEGIADAIIKERKDNGLFTSLSDFLSRIHDRNLNKKSLEALIMTGALDKFGERGQMNANIEMMLTFNKERVAEKESAQESLFNLMSDSSSSTLTLAPAEEAPTIQKLNWEKELLGVYVSGHPLAEHQAELDKRPSIKQIKEEGRNGVTVVTAGMVSSVKELLTKKGDRMAFVTLENQTDQIEMVVFPKTYTDLKEILIAGSCIAIKGKLTIRNDEPSIAVDKAKLLSGKPKEQTTSE